MAKANSYSLVNYERVRYSVPCRYVKETLRLEIFAERIEVWHKNQLVAYHRRSYKAIDMLLELDHYLDALERKPRAMCESPACRVSVNWFGKPSRSRLSAMNPRPGRPKVPTC